MNLIRNQLRVFAISDLHLEFYKSAEHLHSTLKLPNADVLVLAGDIGYPNIDPYKTNYRNLLSLFKKQYEHVLLVPGNHEYYKAVNFNRRECNEALASICRETNVVYLNQSTHIINDVKFYGAPLWSDIDKYAASKLNDFTAAFKNRLDYLEEFIGDYKWLKSVINDKGRDKNLRHVVITHHLPTNRLVHPRYTNNPINSAFATELLDEFELHGVHLWVAGHTHEYAQIKYGDTRFVVNPLGYPDEQRLTKVSNAVVLI